MKRELSRDHLSRWKLKGIWRNEMVNKLEVLEYFCSMDVKFPELFV